MRRIIRSIVVCAVLFAGFQAGLAAQDMSAEQKKAEKEFYESIQREVERLEGILKLEDWQVFYVDSIMTHDYKAMQEELTELRNKKVSNTDMYYEVQDKWQEKMYVAFEGIFDEGQWAKYLKSGAARDKKNRDKRLAKK